MRLLPKLLSAPTIVSETVNCMTLTVTYDVGQELSV